MAELSNTELFDLAGAAEAIRSAARTMEFSKYTMDDVRKQALEYIGGGVPEDSASPLGRLDILDLLEKRVNDIVVAAKKRSASKAG